MALSFLVDASAVDGTSRVRPFQGREFPRLHLADFKRLHSAPAPSVHSRHMPRELHSDLSAIRIPHDRLYVGNVTATSNRRTLSNQQIVNADVGAFVGYTLYFLTVLTLG